MGSIREKDCTIVICAKCEGWGLVLKQEIDDYHKNTYRHWEEVCPKCQGSGRLKIKRQVFTDEFRYQTPEPTK